MNTTTVGAMDSLELARGHLQLEEEAAARRRRISLRRECAERRQRKRTLFLMWAVPSSSALMIFLSFLAVGWFWGDFSMFLGKFGF